LSVKTVFGESAATLPISSTKSMIGHTLGAAGGIESAATVLSIRDQKIHPTIHIVTPDPDCDLDYVPEGPRDLAIRYAMSNSLGFGGHNSSLIFKRHED
ncbi:MAG: beta-ketoacyl-[acyl-carrier-protein] synthase II, partial [Dehalococcoidia bacterium]|nr:beta-ketoacyl-[acyl-carrier-protein] synthase II [Dehalococcoidia bacterium]